MALTPHVCNLQYQIPGNFALNSEVVLLGVLRARILRGLTDQKNRTKDRPVDGLTSRRVQDAVERIGECCAAILPKVRSIELRVDYEGAVADRVCRSDLLQDLLLESVI